jgi:pimeloyl-ACP methyl ester carboxylesterase
MHDELGFERYGAHGGDLGTAITVWLAQAHPESVAGIHLLDLLIAPPAGADLSDEERAYLSAFAAWSEEEGAFVRQQRTRPLTLAPGLSDSPAGLLAWMLEKYRAWSDCGGDVSTRYTTMPRGGHFAPHEEPALLAADITAFFRPLAAA